MKKTLLPLVIIVAFGLPVVLRAQLYGGAGSTYRTKTHKVGAQAFALYPFSDKWQGKVDVTYWFPKEGYEWQGDLNLHYVFLSEEDKYFFYALVGGYYSTTDKESVTTIGYGNMKTTQNAGGLNFGFGGCINVFDVASFLIEAKYVQGNVVFQQQMVLSAGVLIGFGGD